MATEADDLLANADVSDTEGKAAGNGSVIVLGERKVDTREIPVGVWILERIGLCRFRPRQSYKVLVYFLTFFCYTCYHLSRKPFSVVKVVLCPGCGSNTSNDSATKDGWAPFNNKNGHTLLGAVDYSFLFAYAITMFISGVIADRMSLRYFLTIGMLGSAISVALVGVARFARIHHIGYFIGMQIFGGVMQSTGWPGVVAVMGNWFGKQRRGFLLGLWNTHTSLGNILGTVIPSFWATAKEWGWSFVVPAFIMAGMAVIIFLFLVNDPQHVGLPPPVHHLDQPEFPSPVREREGEEKKEINFAEAEQRHREEGGDTEDGDGVVLISDRSHEQSDTVQKKKKAVNFFRALMIPGVVEFALALFFNKLVSYTFLFWLPLYVQYSLRLSGKKADWLSTLFDVGGIIGGIVAGLVSDLLRARAVTCVVMLILAVPSLFCLRYFGDDHLSLYIILLVVCGSFINGPYAIITTAVSSDLGTHKSLKGDQNAKATVTAIIDGTGSLGAACGPLLVGLITNGSQSSWNNAFYLLMGSSLISALFLSRLVVSEVKPWILRLLHSGLTNRIRHRHEEPIELQALSSPL